MSLRILKSRPKPNLGIAGRRKPLNAGETNGNEINKSQPDKLSKREEEVETPFGVSPTSIPSDSKSPIVTNGADASEQANSSIINNLSEHSGNNLKITQSEKINKKNEVKAEMCVKKEIVLSETVSDTTQKPDTETKLSTDVGGNERKLKVRPKPNISSINRRRACPPLSESEGNSTINLPLKPTSTTERSNGSNNPFVAEASRCSKELETNSRKKVELKKEGIPISNSNESSEGPVRKKICPNLLQSHKTTENTLKPLVGSLISERKPEKLQLGEETISSTKPVEDNVSKIKPQSSCLKSSVEDVTEKYIKSVPKPCNGNKKKLQLGEETISSTKPVEDNVSKIKPQSSCLKSSVEDVTEKYIKSVPKPCNGNKKLFHQNFKVKVNPKVLNDASGKKTLRVKITIDDSDGKKPKKDVNSEKEKKKEETLNKLLGKDTGSTPDDGIHLSYELDTSDDSNISDCKETVIASDSAVGRVSPLVSSSCRSSRMNNVKPNLATASTRFSPFNQLSYAQMNQDAKQKFKLLYGDRSPERSKMTMKDLIFYNPKNNPISEQSSKNKDLLPETEIISNSDANQLHLNSEDSDTLNVDDDIEEEQVNSDGNKAMDKNGVPVPQLKITADGKIIIAPESLVVKTKHDTAEEEWRPLIVENDFTHHKIMKKKSFGEKKNWTFQETLKFYKVLHTSGSDFSTMARNFPERTRNCLKRKFKREEKLNGHLIDRVLPGKILTDEEFEAVEKELAVNKMWEEIEKCSRRRSDLLPEIPDISQGITDDMFLSVKEKKNIRKKGMSKTSAKPENRTAPYVNILLDDVSNLTKTNAKTKSNKHKPKTKRKILRLKEYFSNKEDTPLTSQASINSLIKNRVLQISKNDTENRSASDDEVMIVEEDVSLNKPIVVNTSIESSGIKYTKSITFNPSNLDNPVDINETISHNVQEHPTSTDIIDEIVNILSSDGQSPTVHNLEIGNKYYNGARNNSDNSESQKALK